MGPKTISAKTWRIGENELGGIVAGLLGSLANYVDTDQLRSVVRSLADDDAMWMQLKAQSDQLKRLLGMGAN